MKTKILGLLVLCILIISCSKDDELTVKLTTSGSLSVQLTDNEGNFIPDTKVKLYDFNDADDYLDAFLTNSQGEVNFGELLYGSYKVVADTPKVDGIKYIPEKNVQVVSGIQKKLEINVQDYAGRLEVIINKATYLGGGPFIDLGVIIVPVELYSDSYTVRELIDLAEFSDETDSDGAVSFNNPSGRDFQLIVCKKDKSKKVVITSFNLLKDELRKISLRLDTSLYVMNK